jgi:hypothetical protein
MAREDDHQHQASRGASAAGTRPTTGIRDLPALIKYILLIFLIVLFFVEWYGGEYTRQREWGLVTWLILWLKIILIIGILILIWVQRKLKCSITAPSGCATPEYDAALDKWIIKVMGTAGGYAFGSYTLHVEKPAGTPFPVPVIYPGGGSSGGSQVVNGELGRLDVSTIEPAPMRVVLTVHPAGSGSASVCTSDFDIMNRIVWIEAIGGVPARIMGPHPDDGTEILKLVKFAADPPLPAPAGPEASLAEGISVSGGADVSGCGRQMVEYALQYRQIPAAMPSPWQMDAPMPGWAGINSPLPYGPPGDVVHPRTFLWFGGQVWHNVVRNGVLSRVWGIGQFLMSIFPVTYAARAYTAAAGWDTTGLNGRFTVRLVVKHQPVIGPPSPTPPELYDSATVWIDNRQIEGVITHLGIAGGGSLGVCDELSLAQFVAPGPVKINATINGRAWDPIITDDYPGGLRPNDNFNRYDLALQKNGGGALAIAGSTTRVPNLLQETPLPVLPAGTGMLHLWDIVDALDAGPPQAGPAPYPKIYRGDRCAYIIHLDVTDQTPRGDGGPVHHAHHDFPFCIENDIPANAPFPIP